MNAGTRARAGLTLVELVLVLALTAVLTGAVGYGFVAGLDQQRRHTARQADTDPVASLEREITRLIEGAKLTEDAEDTTTYMVGAADATGDTGTLGCDTLTFTTTAGAPDFGPLLSDDDYETQYTVSGPVGGVTEVQLGGQLQGRTESVSGLLIRTQRPSDGDYTQGGTQRVLSTHVDSIGFRFWNGASWDDTWDTATERRLPGAILVSYVLADDATETVRSFTVAVPASDVDANNTVTGSVE
jgi:Tfp pilus assembly protein PilE